MSYITINFAPHTDKITDDGTELTQVPYPFHVNLDGTVQRQDLWNGNPHRVIGFVQRLDLQQVDLWWSDFVKRPQSVTGMYLITASRNEGEPWGTHLGAITSVLDHRVATAEDIETVIHIEHCCVVHGCKYADTRCPVKNGTKRQSYRCEQCDWEIGELRFPEWTDELGEAMREAYTNSAEGTGLKAVYDLLKAKLVAEVAWSPKEEKG